MRFRHRAVIVPFVLTSSGRVRTSSGRLRAPIRLLLATGFFLLVVLAVSMVVLFVGIVPPVDSPIADPIAVAVPHLLAGSALSVAVVVAARYLDRRRLDDLGLVIDRSWWRDLVVGLCLGFGFITAAYAVGVLAGVYDPTVSPAAPEGYSILGAFVLIAAFTGIVGLYEELLFRGYLLPNVAEGLTAFADERTATFAAVAISSVLFGLVHGANPGMTLFGIGTITVAGVLLGLGYVFTGRLALPIGIHVTWNFAHFVFGLPVSGLDLGIRLVRTELLGPAIVHGGPVGPEGGILGFTAAVGGCLVVVLYSRSVDGVSPEMAAIPTLRDRANDADRDR